MCITHTKSFIVGFTYDRIRFCMSHILTESQYNFICVSPKKIDFNYYKPPQEVTSTSVLHYAR